MAFNRLGVANSTSEPTTRAGEQELFRTLYLTEVVKAFQENNVMSGLTQARSISSGKSATFPTFWKTNAHYHAPGDADLDGTNQVRHDEIVITCDRVLMSDIKVAEIEELINHFDVRGMYAEQMGNALAQAYDKQLMAMAYHATSTKYDRLKDGSANQPAWAGVARETATPTAMNTPALLVDGIYEALQTLEEYDVPTEGLVCILKPQEYYILINGNGSQSVALDRDYGGEGSIAAGVVPRVAGIPIIKSNNLPTTHLNSASAKGAVINGVELEEHGNDGTPAWDDGVPDLTPESGSTTSKYAVDARNFKGLILHPTCLGTVKLMDLKYEDEYLIQKQATLMVAKMAVGHGVLREEACFALKST